MSYLLILIINLIILGIWYKYRRKKGKDLPWFAGWILPSDILVFLGFLLMGIFAIVMFFSNDFPMEQKRTEKEMSEMKKSIIKFKKDNKGFPDSIEELIRKNPLKKNWKEDYWETPYKLSKKGDQSMELISAGSDRQFGTKDDLRIIIID
ncbi:type II secretion system protein GspG [Belliella kenyensis]|nr:type II secretion system protein GspG [Belliella kenyensis]MDN3604978.1 type II secretion system protein GspG [Belliella kenyensis]